MRDPRTLVAACRVPDSAPWLPSNAIDRTCEAGPFSVCEGRRGPWEIVRYEVAENANRYLRAYLNLEGLHSYVALHRDTIATMMRPRGECVMDDSPREIRRHLPILLRARGRVLVTGLGLGCVLRGLLSIPDVEHVDVVEIDPYVFNWVGQEFIGNPRVTLHLGDAMTIRWAPGARWSYAWHDVWVEPGEPHLDCFHSRLIMRYREDVCWQGAWQMARPIKRRLPPFFINGPRRRMINGARVIAA